MATKYQTDQHNRLVYFKTGRRSGVRCFKTTVDGRFVLDDKNRLTYTYVDPQNSRGTKSIKLNGKWKLNRREELVYVLSSSRKESRDRLVFKGRFIHSDLGEIVYSLGTIDDSGYETIYLLKFGGAWNVDAKNRLRFNVLRSSGRYESLTFKGAWEVDKNYSLSYVGINAAGLSKHTFTFKGKWDITRRYRLSYSLSGDSNSTFNFRTRLARYDEKRRAFVYTISVGLKPIRREVCLQGTWRVNKKLGLVFAMHYNKKEIQSISFGAKCKVLDNYNIQANLKNSIGEGLGLSVKLSKKMFSNLGELYLKGSTTREAWDLGVGVGVRF